VCVCVLVWISGFVLALDGWFGGLFGFKPMTVAPTFVVIVFCCGLLISSAVRLLLRNFCLRFCVGGVECVCLFPLFGRWIVSPTGLVKLFPPPVDGPCRAPLLLPSGVVQAHSGLCASDEGQHPNSESL